MRQRVDEYMPFSYSHLCQKLCLQRCPLRQSPRWLPLSSRALRVPQRASVKMTVPSWVSIVSDVARRAESLNKPRAMCDLGATTSVDAMGGTFANDKPVGYY
jgi:hypothetical protein